MPLNKFNMELLLRSVALVTIFLATHNIHAKDNPPIFLPNHVTQMLGDKTISAILRHRGNLWIGTQNGMYIYDGRSLQMPAENKKELGSFFGSHITDLAISDKGDIWISSINRGVVKYTADTGSFGRPLAVDESILISTLNIDRDGNLWIGSDKGAYLIDLGRDEASVGQSLNSPIIDDNNITGIIEDDLGFVWVTSDQGLYVYSQSENLSQIFCPLEDDICDVEYTSIHSGAKGRVYVGSGEGILYAIDITTREVSQIYDTAIHGTRYITSILEAGDTIWIGTDEGLVEHHMTSNTGEFFNIKNSDLANDHITTISPAENGLWVATYKGLNLLVHTAIANYNFKNSRVFNEVLSFAEDETGRIFIGTYQGVYYFDIDESKHKLLSINGDQNGDGTYRTMSVAYHSNELYVGTRGNGLKSHRFDKKIGQSFGLELNSASITKIHVDDESILWVGTFSKGLFRLSPRDSSETEISQRAILPGSYGPVVSLSPALNDRLLAATESRLFQIDHEGKNPAEIEFKFADLEFRPVILAAKTDESGSIWIGTLSSGLYRLSINQSVAERVNFREGIYAAIQDLSIYEIQIDSLGNIWCATSNGIHKFDSEATHMGDLGVNDGLQGKTFNFGASFKDSQGNLYFGGSNGYNKFHPSDIEFPSLVPRMGLTSVSINGKPHSEELKLQYLENILLTHSESNLHIGFHIDDYFSPQEAIYLHQLVPFQSAFNRTVGYGIATYTNLPPGEYSFHAQGTDSSGNTNTEGIKLKITVLPAPWQTWWAYTLYLLVTVGVLWALWRWYYMYLLKQKAMAYAKEMNAEAENAIDELQEQLDVQDELVNSVHRRNIATLEMLGSLNTLSDGAIDDANSSQSQRSISALKCLENSLLYQHDHLYADLHRCTDDITTSLLAEAGPNSESVSIINDVTNKPIDASVGALLVIAISELTHNSIVHAFGGRRLGNFIKISVQVTEQPDKSLTNYRLSVNDNGVGLPSEFLAATTQGAKTLTLVAELLGGELSCPDIAGSEVVLTFTKKSFETE